MLSIYTEVVHLKPFHNTLNCASTANIEEAVKFYNLGDKTFETDFNITLSKCASILRSNKIIHFRKKVEI